MSPATRACLALLVLGACAPSAGLTEPPLSADEGRARVAPLLPAGLPDRDAWARDIYAAFAALEIRPIPRNVCAAIAVIQQESGFRADPPVPGLPRIARRALAKRAEAAGVPPLVLAGALMIPSSDGRSYAARIDAVRTERELSELYEEMIGRVPLVGRFLAARNPVRTGGPMQVSVAFAESHAEHHDYPYPVAVSIRHEVFTRRGGVFFGIAHLLGYPVAYDRMLYRFADYNAGHYASRNAAFQAALEQVSGIPIALDGDLVAEGAPDNAPGATERAARVAGRRLGLDDDAIRRDLDRGRDVGFDETELARGVFAEADRLSARPAPRALLPRIQLTGPKVSRDLTTAWFAERVDGRYRACLARAGIGPAA